MLFSKFSEYLNKLESISSRIEMTKVLAELFHDLDSDEFVVASYLMQGRLVPLYESLEFGMSVKMLIRAIARSSKFKVQSSKNMDLFGEVGFEESEEKVKKLYKELGDVGLVAVELKRDSSISVGMTIRDVYEKLVAIAEDGGVGSQDRKVEATAKLLDSLDGVSAKFVARIIIGKLRLGFSTMTMIDALSWAVHGDKSDSKFLEDLYNRKADVGELGRVYLELAASSKQQAGLQEIYSVQTGVPVVPALCQRLNTSAEIIEKMETVIAEPKYDGMRVQLHALRAEIPNSKFQSSNKFQIPNSKKKNQESRIKEEMIADKQNPEIKRDSSTHSTSSVQASVGMTGVKMFTRNLDDISHMFPELVSAVEDLNCDSCILDGEVIGFDPQTGKLLNFQETITRRRKHDVGEKAKDVPVKMFVFDIISLNDQSLLDSPLLERKKKIKEVLGDNKVFVQTPYIVTSDPAELHKYHEENLGDGLEGIVSKKIDSIYQSGRKGWTWVKTKESEGTSGKLADTLDVVIMGYYYGRGKRTEFGMGAILVGVIGKQRAASGEQVLSIAKIGTGMSDEILRSLVGKLESWKVESRPSEFAEVPKTLIPDVWVEPAVVVEVAADEITKSPSHAAGVALRFPRLIRVRDDKDWQQATSLEELEGIGV